MIVWEPIAGQDSGYAVFDEGTGRERKIVVQSRDDYEFLNQWESRKHGQDRNIAYGDCINELRKLQELRNEGKRHDG